MDMADMLDYIDQLNELDTTGIEPMSIIPVLLFREVYRVSSMRSIHMQVFRIP